MKRLCTICDCGRVDGRGRLGHFLLKRQKILLAPVKDEPLAQRRTARDRKRTAMARRIHGGHRAGRLCDDLFQRVSRKTSIERQRDRAGAHRPEEEFDEFRAVSDQHGNALAGRYAEPSQHARDRIHPLVELPIARAPLVSAEQIDDCNLLRHARHGGIEEEAEIAPTIYAVHGDQAGLGRGCLTPSARSEVTNTGTCAS